MRPLLLALSLAACQPAEPSTFMVTPAPDGELDDPSVMAEIVVTTTIQAAIDASSYGDTVIIPSGTYYEDLYVDRGITIQGAGQGETVLAGTITTGNGYTSIRIMSMSVHSVTWLAKGTPYVDAYGILVDGCSAIELEDLDVQGFVLGIHVDSGDGVYVYDSDVRYNQYGVRYSGCKMVRVYNSFFAHNSIAGLAIDYTSKYESAVAYNTFVGNGFGASGEDLAGALGIGHSYVVDVLDNIIVSNDVGYNCNGCTADAGYNLVWGNSTDYVNDASAASTDLSCDPLFQDAAEDDYHLSASSPAIDAGEDPGIYVYTDHEGEARPQGAGYDLGYDEHAVSAAQLVITEVMANAAVEDSGEFVEIYNAGSGAADLAGLILSDGDDADTLIAWGSLSTSLAAGEYALVIDAEYASDYALTSDMVLLTTTDTNLGNGLTTSDSITLFESDGSTIISSMSHPQDPGDGVSLELSDLEGGDVAGNWRASQCDDGSSPCAAHCFPDSGDPTGLVITEVMANALDDTTGEYVEIYNPTDTEIDLGGLTIYDGDGWDALQGWDGGSTLLGAYAHGLVMDPDFAGDFQPPAGTVLVTTSDSSIGNGLANSTDPVYLYDSDQSTLIDSFTHLWDAGDGISWEKIDYAAGDDRKNWDRSSVACASNGSPGRLNGAAGGLCGTLLISEVMANAEDEDTGEFVELYNAGSDTVDLAGLILFDGDADDTIAAYDGGTTELAPGEYALVLDAEYAGEYSIDSAAVLVSTEDTTLGNAIAVNDELLLYEADGTHLVDAYLWPSNPGNGISSERVALAGVLDSEENWSDATCASGSSPGIGNCASGEDSGSAESQYAGALLISEIMSNPETESTGEFVEIYNAGSADIDLYGFVIYDGDADDPLEGFDDPTDTVLAAGQYAVILDPDYAGEYDIAKGALLLTTDDATVASGLAVSDPVYLYEDNGVSLIDSYSYPLDAGNGTSVERVERSMGDEESNWAPSECEAGCSPGEWGCF